MKYHSLDGNLGTGRHFSNRHGCGGRMLRNVSDVEEGDSQATVATCLWYWKRILQEFRWNTIVLMESDALGSVPPLIAVAEAVCYETVVM